MYFWRTVQQQEIDYVEEREGAISAFEFKWSNSRTRFPHRFLENYKATGIVIDRNNFREFVIVKE